VIRPAGAARVAVVALVAWLAGCTPPPPQTTAAGPRFVETGPDAEEQGASRGYPLGDRSTFFRMPFLVGSQSHLDQILESRLVRRAATPSPLARAAAEPALRYEYEGRSLTLDDYLARHPATGPLATTRSSSSAINTRGPTGIGSRRGPWPRRSPRC
jgi:hypothetical protein